MALITASALPEDRKLTGIVLLAAAVSPAFDVRPAVTHVERAIWNYHSKFDWFFLEFRHHSVGDAGRPTGLRRWGVRIRSRSRNQVLAKVGSGSCLSLASMEDWRNWKKLRCCFWQVAMAVHRRSW